MKTLKHQSTLRISYVFLFLNMVFILTLNGQIINVERQRILTDTIGWSGNFGISINASKNTKSYFTFNGQSHVQHKSEKNLWLMILNYNLVNAGGEDFGKSGFGHLRYNRKFTPAIYLELFTQGQFNEISKISIRYLNGAGFRIKLREQESVQFYFGTTLMHEYEEIINSDIINQNYRVSSYFTFTLIPESSIILSNTTYIQPKLSNFRDYRLTNDTQLIFKITEKLKFISNFHFLHDEVPPEGVPKNSFHIRNGLTYQF